MEDSQLAQYVPVLILGLVAVGFAFATLVASVLLGETRPAPFPHQGIRQLYECGFVCPWGTAATRVFR